MTYSIRLMTGKFPASQKQICCLANLFPSNQFLIDTYGLKLEDKILVLHTKRINNSKFHWKGYRTNLKKIFYGTVAEFFVFCRNWYEKKVWKKKTLKQIDTQEKEKI